MSLQTVVCGSFWEWKQLYICCISIEYCWSDHWLMLICLKKTPAKNRREAIVQNKIMTRFADARVASDWGIHTVTLINKTSSNTSTSCTAQSNVSKHRRFVFTPQLSGLEGYCCHGPGGRLGGRLPNLRNPYLGNHLTDFLNSKFCGIV